MNINDNHDETSKEGFFAVVDMKCRERNANIIP